MKTKLIAGFLLAGSCLFAAPRIAIGVGVGVGVPVAPYGYVAPAPVYVAPAPVAPGPGFTWVAGFGMASVRTAFGDPVIGLRRTRVISLRVDSAGKTRVYRHFSSRKFPTTMASIPEE